MTLKPLSLLKKPPSASAAHRALSFAGPDNGKCYVFDSAQALRGLLAAEKIAPGGDDAARHAAGYILTQLIDEGRGGFGEAYNGSIPESVRLEFYVSRSEALSTSSLTHFPGYELEALIDLYPFLLSR